MKILAIRLARFGDVVLLLPALTLLKSCIPNCRITFLTDSRLAPLAELCPAIDEIIPVDRLAMRDGARWHALKSMARVIRVVRRRKPDLVIDFHGFRETNLLTWLSKAPKRIGMKRNGESFLEFCFNLPSVLEDKNLHVRDMFLEMIEAIEVRGQTVRSPLVVPLESLNWVRENLPARPYAAIYVDAPTPKRIWPPAYFAEVADYLSARLGMYVVAIAGPQGEPLLQQLKEKAKHPEMIHTAANLSISQLAATVYTAELLISNDTGPMHLGPILGIPTLGLFSIGLPEHFRPFGKTDRYLRFNPIEGISAEEVIREVGELRSTVRRDLRR